MIFPFSLYSLQFACGTCLSSLYPETVFHSSEANISSPSPLVLFSSSSSSIFCLLFPVPCSPRANQSLCWELSLGASCADAGPFITESLQLACLSPIINRKQLIPAEVTFFTIFIDSVVKAVTREKVNCKVKPLYLRWMPDMPTLEKPHVISYV